jgi:SRSO17 transposase
VSSSIWEKRLDRWLQPFIAVWGDKRRHKWATLYLLGLILPGERKSIAPIASRVAPDDEAQLHHFVADSPWSTAPLEEVLAERVNAMLGGKTAHLVIDDTSLPKKGEHSVGVAHQYCGALGKQANCQVMVSLTLVRDELLAPIGLRLFLPEAWSKDSKRRVRAKVPASVTHQPKWQMALEEIDRVIAAGVEFGDVLADAGYGMCAEFRHGLSERKLSWAVGIASTQNMYNASVQTSLPASRTKPRTRMVTNQRPCSAKDFIEQHSTFRKVTWREGTKGPLSGDFAIARVCPADGRETKDRVHLPGDPAWLVCERLSNNDRKYYLANLPSAASRIDIIRAIKARWACELGHQQMKEELGLDHFEARSWIGLHHHALLTMIAFAFLTHVRLTENKDQTQPARAPTFAPRSAAGGRPAARCVQPL